MLEGSSSPTNITNIRQAWNMTSIRLHHAGSLWWRSSMGLHGSATCCKLIEASNWSICQAQNATFSDILSILSWFGGPFQSGSVHLECDIKFERVDVKFGTIDSQSAVLLYWWCLRLHSSCRSPSCSPQDEKNNQATSSNYRTVSSQWSFWTVAYCGVASLLLLALCTHIIPLQTPQPLLSLLCLQPANSCQLIAEHNLGSNHPKTGENQNISK